jgi:DnaK suppressor protein
MDEAQRGRYADALRVKQAELLARLNEREGLEAESEADVFDEIQRASDRALVIETLDRTSALLRDVRKALERVADGGYGQCLNCEEEISPKRLAAVPWAKFCLRCQEEADRQEQESFEGIDFASAA